MSVDAVSPVNALRSLLALRPGWSGCSLRTSGSLRTRRPDDVGLELRVVLVAVAVEVARDPGF